MWSTSDANNMQHVSFWSVAKEFVRAGVKRIMASQATCKPLLGGSVTLGFEVTGWSKAVEISTVVQARAGANRAPVDPRLAVLADRGPRRPPATRSGGLRSSVGMPAGMGLPAPALEDAPEVYEDVVIGSDFEGDGADGDDFDGDDDAPPDHQSGAARLRRPAGAGDGQDDGAASGGEDADAAAPPPSPPPVPPPPFDEEEDVEVPPPPPPFDGGGDHGVDRQHYPSWKVPDMQGRLVFDPHRNSLAAHCDVPEHNTSRTAKCIINRNCEAWKGALRTPKQRSQGRPVGFLLAWLHCQQEHGISNKAEHVAFKSCEEVLIFAERSDCRANAVQQECPFLIKERNPRLDEGDEPQGLP